MEQIHKLIDFFETKNKLQKVLDEPCIEYELKDNVLYVYQQATFDNTNTKVTVHYTLCIDAEHFQTSEDMNAYDLFANAFSNLILQLMIAEPTIATKLNGCLVNYQNANEVTIGFDLENKHVLFVLNIDVVGNGYKVLYMNVEQAGSANTLYYDDIPKNISADERALYYVEQLK